MTTTTQPFGGIPLPDRPDARHPFWKLFLITHRHLWMFLVVLATVVLHHGSTLIGATISGYVVGLAVTGASVAQLTPWLWVLAACVVGRALGSWSEMWLAHDLAYRVLAEIRATLYRALERLAPALMLERRSGDLGTMVMSEIEKLEWFYAHTVSVAIVATAITVAALGALAWLFHPLLALVLLPMALLLCTVPAWLGRLAGRQGEQVQAALVGVNADVVDAVQGLREIVTFGQGANQLSKLATRNDALVQAQLRYAGRKGFEGAATRTLVAIGVVVVLAVGGWLVSTGQLPYVLFPAAVALAGSIFGPLVEVTGIAQNFGMLNVAARRVFDLLEEQPQVQDRVATPPATAIEPVVRFEGVTFRYKPELPAVLSEVSFTIQPGETVALVGHSGAGKSTCTHLLMRFWDVSSGRITVGGHDIRDLPQETLRALIAPVPQEIYLFNQPIADNLRLGKPTATDAELEAATQAALAHEFIQALPQGYATNAGERAVQLSGGQRQRLAIARALLKDAPILVMDEAVSNLDTENERLLQAAMAQLRQGRTTLLIAHRLSTIRSADRIVVLAGGRVAEVGTHDALLARNGEYARLIASQRAGILPT